MRALQRLSFLALTLVACHSNSSNTVAPSDQTRARIENRSSLNMDVSVVRNDGRRSPLGLVAAGQTASFALPSGVTAGASWIRFQATPVRGSGSAQVSEIFQIRSGEEIKWSVSPQ